MGTVKPQDYLAQLDDRLRSQRDDFDAIPVIDIASLRDGSNRSGPAKEIRWALANTGFMYVKSHGVPSVLLNDAFEAARRFFALPLDQKMAVHISNSGPALRGYTELYGENMNPGVTQDIKECFDAGLEYPGPTGPFRGANQWPAIAGFRNAVEAHLNAMTDLAKTILEGIAVSLDLDRHFFEPLRQHPMMIQRLIHYPSQTGYVDEGEIGIGAHSDYGLMTILAQDDIGGLQALNHRGQWVEAHPIAGTYAINISDLLQRLTNDFYFANLHRVVNISGTDRYSLPCFVDGDFEAKIAPLSAFVTDDAPLAYDPVRCGDHKLSRYVASFPHLADA